MSAKTAPVVKHSNDDSDSDVEYHSSEDIPNDTPKLVNTKKPIKKLVKQMGKVTPVVKKGGSDSDVDSGVDSDVDVPAKPTKLKPTKVTDKTVDKAAKATKVADKATKSTKATKAAKTSVDDTVDAVADKSAKSHKPTTEEAKAKRLAEEARLNAEYEYIVGELGLVSIFPDLIAPRFQDKLANAVIMYAMQTINEMQKTEVTKDVDYNPFNPVEYILTNADKQTTSKKASIKTRGAASKGVLTRKKTAAAAAASDGDDSDSGSDSDVDSDGDVKDNGVNGGTTTDDKDAAKSTKKTKKPVATFTKGGKSYLTFFIMRFTDDLRSADTAAKRRVKSNDEFKKFVFEQVDKGVTAHVSRSVVATVERYRGLVDAIGNHPVMVDYVNHMSNDDGFKDFPFMMNFVRDYLGEYLKLIGYFVAQQLWVTKKQINQTTIESVIRMLDTGNSIYYETHYPRDETDYGLNCGFYQDARIYDERINPKKPVTRTSRKKLDAAESVSASASASDVSDEE